MRNKDKTHCKHGHEFTPDNTRVVITVYENGSENKSRLCKECQKRRTKAWLMKKGKVVKRITE